MLSCIDTNKDDSNVQMNVMRMLEEKIYSKKNNYFDTALQMYNRKSFPRDHKDTMNNSWRMKMCLWSYMVVDHFEIDREVVDISFNYLDRYLSQLFRVLPSHPGECIMIDRNSFQLVSATTLYIAIKLHGGASHLKTYDKHLIGIFAQLSRGLFTIEDVGLMEREILSALKWHMNPPTSAGFVLHLLKSGIIDMKAFSISCFPANANPERAIYEVAKFFTELAVGDFDLSISRKPSCIAVACILNAMSFFIECDDLSKVSWSISRSLTSHFQFTTIELNSISYIQEKLRKIVPFPYNQPSASIIRDIQDSNNPNVSDIDIHGLLPNQTLLQSLSSPVSTSLFTHG